MNEITTDNFFMEDGASVPIRWAEVDGKRYISFDDVMRACETASSGIGIYRAKSNIQKASRNAIERELQEGKEFIWVDAITQRGTKRVRFLTPDRGAARVASHFQNEVGWKVRDYLLDRAFSDGKSLSLPKTQKHEITQYEKTPIDHAILLLTQMTQNHDQNINNLDTRVNEVENRLHKDPNEGISAVDGLIEAGKDPSTIISGRKNYEQWVGTWLKNNGYQSLGKSQKRLSGCGVVTYVNLWRRCDIREAIKASVVQSHSGKGILTLSNGQELI